MLTFIENVRSLFAIYLTFVVKVLYDYVKVLTFIENVGCLFANVLTFVVNVRKDFEKVLCLFAKVLTFIEYVLCWFAKTLMHNAETGTGFDNIRLSLPNTVNEEQERGCLAMMITLFLKISVC